jgi:multidrug efflux pump subunit AcrA (membrane-fusion protein)
VGVWRKWIFPIIRILIFAAIAAALVKIAFFGDIAQESNPETPTATITEPQVAVEIGTIQNDVVLQGTVAADEAVEVKATAPGVLRAVKARPGASVAAGAELFVIREEVMRQDGTSWFRDIKVTAPASGIVSSVAVLVGQSTSIGDTIAKIAPPTFHVSATLAPEQQYRLLSQPADAQVQVLGGPAPFTCTGLSISTALAGAAEGDPGSGTTVRCVVPAEVRVFAGLAAEVTIAGGIAENVMTAPITAVEGTSETGNVYFVLPDGSTELRAVTLGLNDGITVEVKDGVAEGDLILQFIPGAEENPEGMGENCYPIPGGMACEGVGG